MVDTRAHDTAMERFELLVAGTDIGIWDWDVQTDACWWSPRFFELLGHAPNEIEASWGSLLERIHPEDVPRIAETLERHFEDDTPYGVEYRIIGPDGHYRWFAAQGKMVRNADGTPRRMVGWLSDVHDRKLAELRLEQSNVELKQFAYAASHDLKAPLRHIKSFAALLEAQLADNANERVRLLLGFITKGVTSMDKVVDGVLKVAQVDGSALVLQPTSLREMVDTALDAITGAVLTPGESHAQPCVEVIFDNDIELFCEANLMRRVLQNALQNAVQHARLDVPPVVRITARRGQTHTEITLDDNGVGLAPRHRERVFHIFARLSQEGEGTGIGLAICQKIIALHNGEIWFDEPPTDAGARLRIRIPI
jgi:PAS domain S-box-containing protein